RRAVPRALALAFLAAQCVSVAVHVVSYEIVDVDTADSVQMARTCVERGPCATMGTHASAFQLHHGFSWIRLLPYWLPSHGGLQSVQTIVLGLLMVSAAIACLLAWRYVSPTAALLMALWYAQPTLATARFMVLTNAVLLPLPVLAYYASAALCVEFGSAMF